MIIRTKDEETDESVRREEGREGEYGGCAAEYELRMQAV